MKSINLFKQTYYPIYLIIFFIWIFCGMFPLICYESDSLNIIKGCEIMSNQGLQLPPLYSYEYRMQPLITIIVVTLKKIVPFLTCEEIYCLFTLVCSYLFIVSCVSFVNLIMKENKVKILIALCLLPESYAIALYPNSAIPAAVLFVLALISIYKDKRILSIVLMIFAPLFRLDILVVYPAILPLFYYKGQSITKSFITSTYYAIIIIPFLYLFFYLLGADFISTFNGYESWNNSISKFKVLIAVFAFYGIIYFILMPIGLYSLCIYKKMKLLILVIVPISLVHFTYMQMGCAAKHYLYIVPFCLILGVEALNLIRRKCLASTTITIISILLVAFISFVSIKIDLKSRPHLYSYNSNANIGPFKSIGHPIPFRGNTIRVGLGVGQVLPTLDEFMLTTGQFFYPFYIHSLKVKRANILLDLENGLKDIDDIFVITLSWEGKAFFPNKYLEKGYSFSMEKELEYYTSKEKNIVNANKLCDWNSINDAKSDLKEFIAQFDLFNVSKSKEIFILAHKDRSSYYLNILSKEEKSLEQINQYLYKLNL